MYSLTHKNGRSSTRASAARQSLYNEERDAVRLRDRAGSTHSTGSTSKEEHYNTMAPPRRKVSDADADTDTAATS